MHVELNSRASGSSQVQIPASAFTGLGGRLLGFCLMFLAWKIEESRPVPHRAAGEVPVRPWSVARHLARAPQDGQSSCKQAGCGSSLLTAALCVSQALLPGPSA